MKENWDENRAKKETGVEVAKQDWVDTSHFGLLYHWAKRRDELAPWWSENGASPYNAAAPPLESHYQLPQGKVDVPALQAHGARSFSFKID